MEESIYTKRVLALFDSFFPEASIKSLSKKDVAAIDYKPFLTNVEGFQNFMVSQYAELVLSGDYLIHEISDVDTLVSRIDGVLKDELQDSSDFAKYINGKVQQLLQDIHFSTRLVKLHAENAKRLLNRSVVTYNVDNIERSKIKTNVSKPVQVLKLICEVCTEEYKFSYDEAYIQKLISYRAQLIEVGLSDVASTVYFTRQVALEKVEFLLYKLALYSKNKKISYKIDFTTHTIDTNDNLQNEDNEFRTLCKYFHNPHEIPEWQAQQWLEDVQSGEKEVWKLVYLMRYYCQHTKSIEQINHIMQISEKQYDLYIQNNGMNEVDDRAMYFFINYMYNSRFSFLCKKKSKGYKYEDLKNDLKHIRMIQVNTCVHNYHPYLKACEYLIDYISDKLSDVSCADSLVDEWDFLNECYAQLKENREWCYVYQPYLMQFRYDFSTRKIGSEKIAVYFPSSVSRPLKFKEIDEKIAAVGNAVQWLKLQINHQPEKAELIKAQQKIDTLEDKNLKHMGYFVTATTFLVGLLSIFIGNSGKVSIFEKMEYVSALGVILLLFVGFGYFALTEKTNKNTRKYSVMFVITMLLAVILGWAAHVGYTNYTKGDDCPSNETNILSEALEAVVAEEPLDGGITKQEVRERLMCFKQLIENNDGYKLLHFDGKRNVKEEDVQLLFRFVWSGTELSVDREVNNGRGPVDYKLSNGADDATLVEFKLANNTKLKQNLQHQVEIYKAANQTESALIPIIYFTIEEYNNVQRILRELNLEDNEDIILIDATEKLSASKVK